MFRRLARLKKWLFRQQNFGVAAPEIFTAYEVKLLLAIFALAGALLWALAKTGLEQGVWGVALIAGLAIYLSYTKYYCTYKPAMDRWGIRELCCPEHPRQEYRVAARDLLISEDEIRFIAKHYRTHVVCHHSADNPEVLIYESSTHYEHRLLAVKWSQR